MHRAYVKYRFQVLTNFTLRMKFSLHHPYKYDWTIINDASVLSVLSDLVRSSTIKGLSSVTDLLQSRSMHGIVIINKNSEPSTLFQHFPILTFLNCNQSLLVSVSQPWSEEVYFIPRSEINDSNWKTIEEIGKIKLPIASQLSFVPIKPQC